jgi:hypothetical protein
MGEYFFGGGDFAKITGQHISAKDDWGEEQPHQASLERTPICVSRTFILKFVCTLV